MIEVLIICITSLLIVGAAVYLIEKYVTRGRDIERSVTEYLKSQIDELLLEVRSDVQAHREETNQFKADVKADVKTIAYDLALGIKDLREKQEIITKTLQLNNQSRAASVFDTARNFRP